MERMRTDYSKSAADVLPETSAYFSITEEKLSSQLRAVARLADCEARRTCLLCQSSLEGVSQFRHRGLVYIFCQVCGHLQTENRPPEGYPFETDEESFSDIYPRLSESEYASRRDRIYTPKLEWALDCAGELGMQRDVLLNKHWLEVGCGAGYFLDALRQAGAETIAGVDVDGDLVEIANQRHPAPVVRLIKGSLTDLIRRENADVYAAFFVFEHVEEAAQLWQALKEKHQGTVLFISVPTFSLSSLLDSSFENQPASMLDGALHTQLYTDQSIDFVLKRAGYEKVAEWIFGADAVSLAQAIMFKLRAVMPPDLLQRQKEALKQLVDPLQSIMDRMRFSDERHLLAIKR